jgi:hypothetical protein
MTKLEKNDDLANLITCNKVSYVKGIRDVWDSWNWTRSSSTKEHKKEITLVVHYHEMEMVHG